MQVYVDPRSRVAIDAFPRGRIIGLSPWRDKKGAGIIGINQEK